MLLAVVPSIGVLDHVSLTRAARLAERHLSGTRLRALAGRDKLQVRMVAPATLETVDAAGAIHARIDLAGGALRSLDSVRIRPATIRFNARGHGSAGSIYLYKGHRGIRVVSNFVGRIRRHSFRF
jgi:hypothetical protein